MELSKTANTTSTSSPFAALAAMFYEPTHAFAMLKERRATWLPLLLTIIATVALVYTYYAAADFEWVKEKMLATITDPAAREQAAAGFTKGTVLAMSLVGAIAGIPVFCLLMGLYFMVAGKFAAKEFTFGDGFSLTAWSLIPTLITTALGFMQIMLSSNGQIEFTALNPSTLNQLFFQIEMGKPWASLLDSIHIATIWQVILLVVGFQVWGNVSRTTALKVTLAPYLVIYGIWIAYTLMSTPA